MEKYYKISLIIFPIVCLFVIISSLILIYIHDSLQIWHKPFFREPTYSYTIRESARAFIRDIDFDSIIIGNSLSENTSAKETSSLLSGNFFNLSISGSTTYEKKIILSYLFKHKDIKQIVYILDNNYMNLRKENANFPVKEYGILYDDNPFNDIKIYLSDRYFWCNLALSKSDLCIGKVKNMDKPYAWDDNKDYKKRFGGFDKWIKEKEQGQVKQMFKKILNTPIEINKEIPDSEYILKSHKYIDENLYSLIEKNPNIKFYIVIPPISDLGLAQELRSKNLTYAKVNEMLRYLTKKNMKYKNVEMYAFNDIKDIGEISKYKDTTHFNPEVNRFIIKSIAKKEHRITSENVEEYIAKVDKKARSVDFKYYYDRIKQVMEK